MQHFSHICLRRKEHLLAHTRLKKIQNLEVYLCGVVFAELSASIQKIQGNSTVF